MKPGEDKPLLSAQDIILSESTVFLYCSLHAETEALSCVPDSVFCDLSVLSSLKTLKGFVVRLGLEQKTMVCYQAAGVDLAAQMWWLLKVIGYEHVCVLDGGLQAFVSAGGRTSQLTSSPFSDFSLEAEIDRSKYKIDSEIRALIASHIGSFQLIDTDGRFLGAVHCSQSLVQTESGKLLDCESLKVLFLGLEVEPETQKFTIVIGKAAPIVLLALAVAGIRKTCLGIVKRDSDDLLAVPRKKQEVTNSCRTEFYSISGNTEYFDAEEERSVEQEALPASLQVPPAPSRKPSISAPKSLHASRSGADDQHSCGCQLL